MGLAGVGLAGLALAVGAILLLGPLPVGGVTPRVAGRTERLGLAGARFGAAGLSLAVRSGAGVRAAALAARITRLVFLATGFLFRSS